MVHPRSISADGQRRGSRRRGPAIAWTTSVDGARKLTAEGLYGRRKMVAHLRRTSMPGIGFGAVDRAMRTLGLEGVRRGKAVRTTVPGKNGNRAADLLNRDFTAPEPNRVWVTDFTYCRTWAGFAYVAFVVDVGVPPWTKSLGESRNGSWAGTRQRR